MIQFVRAASLVALALLVVCQPDGRLVSASSSVRVLDNSGLLDIEAIARVLCEPNSANHEWQISRLSTVDKLVKFFDQQISGEGHALFNCKQQHGEALHLLQELLNASKENVCSAAKLALIEDFHNQFVSTHMEHKESRLEAHRDAAPQLLRLFFMHYAMQVDAVCKRNLVKNLAVDLKQKFGSDIDARLFEMADQNNESKENADSSALFKRTMQKLEELYSAEKYEEVLNVWGLIENSYFGEKLSRDGVILKNELDPQTGEPIRMLVKLRTRGSLDKIKEHCRYNLKPIYSKLILPLIKLADLGYSNDSEQFELEDQKAKEQLKHWYSATQLCEAMLSVKYYEDPTLGPKDFVVITKREANELDGAAAAGKPGDAVSKVHLIYEPDTNSMEGLDRLESVATVEPKKLVKRVKRNLKARRRVIGRAAIKLARNIKALFKLGRVGRIYFPKPTGEGRSAHLKQADQFAEKEDFGQQLSESLESMSDEDMLKLEGSAPSRMLRSRSYHERYNDGRGGKLSRMFGRWRKLWRDWKPLAILTIAMFICFLVLLTFMIIMIASAAG